MLGLFRRKPVQSIPDETTLDRAKMKREALAKLARAEGLKKRSSAVASDLSEEGAVNNYAWRIRQAYAAGGH